MIRTGITLSTNLAQHLQVSTSAVSQLLNKLENQGYIERTINPKNRSIKFKKSRGA
ncbi:MarR family transcriptional regulator [Solibacillus sp. FSL R7-0668]|uniref:MarR family transcriptional regulator n=1 Tax=Solibacillus sp. FSL R7-0668 TaxID=2921688 RepID=UPI0030F9781E